MHSTCLHCTRDLGRNDVVETLPIGRRLAFDAAEGRLWVVCRHCARWNLVPFDTRLESIDACERLFRDTRTRYSTDNIGLARVKEGLELVRIGAPLRPEFASWRYGDSFGRRRRRTLLVTGASALGGAAMIGGAMALGLSALLATQLIHFLPLFGFRSRPTVRVAREGAPPIEINEMMLHDLRFAVDAEHGWAVRTRTLERSPARWKLPRLSDRELLLTGVVAEQVLTVVLASQNSLAGTSRTVREAVALVESGTDLPSVVLRNRYRHTAPVRSRGVGSLPPATSIAAEMMLHEQAERRALQGELRLLQWQWEAADRLAKISDELAMGGEGGTA
jgi:hypothetical protein